MVINLFNLEDAYKAARILNINFENFTPEEFLDGINIELEHGTIDPKTNVTNDNLVITAKIALAHLNEHSNYYNPYYGLRAFEKFLEYKIKAD